MTREEKIKLVMAKATTLMMMTDDEFMDTYSLPLQLMRPKINRVIQNRTSPIGIEAFGDLSMSVVAYLKKWDTPNEMDTGSNEILGTTVLTIGVNLTVENLWVTINEGSAMAWAVLKRLTGFMHEEGVLTDEVYEFIVMRKLQEDDTA